MISIEHAEKVFHSKSGDTHALADVSIHVEKGDIYGIVGFSGAGKSTLLRLVNRLETPDSGTVKVDGQDLSAIGRQELHTLRRKIGMVFQQFNLLEGKTVYHNVAIPLMLAHTPKAEIERRVTEVLAFVELSDKRDAYVSQLSGGQKQRVGIARALATSPDILLCDEATSALDPTTTHSILELIRSINEKLGITVIIITHQMSVVEDVCRHVAILDKGVVVEEGNVSEVFSHPKSAAARRLVFPEGESGSVIAAGPGEHFIRVVFNGADATGTPLIAHMAIEKGIEANIAYASTREIGSKVFGSMLLGIPGGEENVREAVAYMQRSEGVLAEEVEVNAG